MACGVVMRMFRCHPRRRSPRGRSGCEESSRTRTTSAIVDAKPGLLTTDLSDRTLDTGGSSDSSAFDTETDDHMKGRSSSRVAESRPPQHLRADTELDVSSFSSSAAEGILPGDPPAEQTRMAKRRCRFVDEVSDSPVVTQVWHVAPAPDDADVLHYNNDDIESFRRDFLEERALECALDMFGGNSVVMPHRTIRRQGGRRNLMRVS